MTKNPDMIKLPCFSGIATRIMPRCYVATNFDDVSEIPMTYSDKSEAASPVPHNVARKCIDWSVWCLHEV